MTFVLIATFVVSNASAQGRGRGRGAPSGAPPGQPPGRGVPAPLVPRIDLQKAAPGSLPRGYQEPAFARGYTDGFALGKSDNKDGKRYDPVGHRDYRDADQAYYKAYGSRDAYRNNYRAGFRQGYEEGYRANK